MPPDRGGRSQERFRRPTGIVPAVRVSVVVPIYNVEPYLRACLESVAAQGLDDLEVIMVDDGSTDGSPAIAREFAERDSPSKLITPPHGGLGNARNNGAAIASGEFPAFLDSDDVVPPHAYELMLETLDKTGSDFATGNVHRLGSAGTSQTRFLARAFAETRLKTHVTRYTPLLADRIAPNKLWRMSFWREQGLRFPEQRLYEDIPVSLPAHFAARAVDVISDPVYLYRIREGADLTEQSITQRRLEPQALLDRIAAVQDVRDYLDKHGSRRSKRLYDKSIVAEDLSYFLNVLDIADDHFRELFLERMNALLDTAARGTYRDLTAIDRLKWHLVRRRLMPELLEVLRFEKQRMRYTPPVRVGRRWYGDYPFRGDPRLRVPNSVYRLGDELAATSRVDNLRWEGDDLVVEGFGYVSGIGAPERGSQRVSVALLRKGRLRSVRLRTSGVRFKTSPAHRPDATASSRQAVADLEWSGFVARVSAKRLRGLGRWRAGTWDLYVTVRAGGVTRRRMKFSLAGRRPARAVDHATPAHLVLRASPTVSGEVRVEALDRWARVDGHRVLDSELELAGDLRAS